MTWPHPLTHPSTHQPMHPPIGGGVSTDFKSSNRIKISGLVQILLHFYWFGAPHPPGGRGGWSGYLGGEGWCGDLLDDVGMTGTTRERRGDHGDNMGWRPQRQRRPQPWRPHGDLLGAMGMTGTMWGRCGDYGDNEITKNAITFERIEIIEFHLKIWDPWTLPHTCRLQLMCRWGGVLSQIAFLSKKCSSDPQKQNFPVFALDPIRPYLDWALRGFLTSWPINNPLKLQLKWKQSAKFD